MSWHNIDTFSSIQSILFVAIQGDLCQLEESLFFQTITERRNVANRFVHMLAGQNTSMFDSVTLQNYSLKKKSIK